MNNRSRSKRTETKKKSKSQQLSEIAYEKIKQAILRLELAPGQEITEARLAESLQLGRAPVRSALARLCQGNLVQAIPQRGYIISPLTLHGIENLWELRILLETEATRKAAGKLKGKELQELNTIAQNAIKQESLESIKEYLEANRQIHTKIARYSGNERMAVVIEQVIDEMVRVLFLTLSLGAKTGQWQTEHKEIINALVEGNGKEASERMREHLESGRASVLDAVLKSPALMEVNLVPKASVA